MTARPPVRPLARLYVQIYLGFLWVGLMSTAMAAIVVFLVIGAPIGPGELAIRTGVAFVTLPDPDDPAFPRAFREASRDLGARRDVSMYGPDGRLIDALGDPLPPGPPGVFRAGAGLGVRIALPGGRQVVIGRLASSARRRQLGLWLAALVGTVGVGCYPLARRITRRLEAVQGALGRWGDGQLDARVPVDGDDEVAAVALAFNGAADQVQRLFDAQRRVLASTSHELRSPLARVRLALELLGDERAPDRAALIADAIRDVEELDATVGDLLQVGRLAAVSRPADPQPIELRGLAAEEAARVGASVVGAERWVTGDPRLLRRLVRNLLENAVRYGAPPVEVHVTDRGLEVLDRGAGVDPALHDRIFEPFFRPAGHAEGRDGGVGLGLHLVREIARHHGGDVRVEARDGGGSRFVVTL